MQKMYRWCFITHTGEIAYAYFSDEEINNFRIKYPEVWWDD